MILEAIDKIAQGGGTVFQTNTPGVAPSQAAALTQAVAAISQTAPNSNVSTSASGGANTFTPIDLVNAPSQVFINKGIAPQEDIQFRLDSFLNTAVASKIVFDPHGTNACRLQCVNQNTQSLTLAGQGLSCGDALTMFAKKLNSGMRYMVSRILVEDVTPNKAPNFNDITLTILGHDGYRGTEKRVNLSKFRNFKNTFQGAIEANLMSEDNMIDFNTGWKFDVAPGRVYDITIEFVGRAQA